MTLAIAPTRTEARVHAIPAHIDPERITYRGSDGVVSYLGDDGIEYTYIPGLRSHRAPRVRFVRR